MAKRRYETIDLFGRTFTLDTKGDTGYAPIAQLSVNDVYGRCSARKQAIWADWLSWFEQNNGWCGVSSHNCNFFTIQGYVRNFETREMYFCYITHAHNYCVKIDSEVL